MTTMTSQAQMNDVKGNYFNIELFFLRLLGYSFTGNESKIYKIYWLFYFLSSFGYVLLNVYELTKHDFGMVSELQFYISVEMIALAKGFVVHQSCTQIGELLLKIQRDPFLPNPNRSGNDETKIVAECLWFTKIQAMVYYFLPCLNITINTLYVIFIRLTSSDYHDWFFPYGPVTVLNVSQSPNYEITCFYQIVSMTFCGLTFASVDLLLSSCLAHISYQFKILQNYIRQLVIISRKEMVKSLTDSTCSNDETTRCDVSWNILKRHLKKAIRYHVAILNLADEVERLFSNLLLFVFVGTLSILCLSIYATTLSTNSSKMVSHLLETIASGFQVLVICYWGEQVSHESNLVGQAAYEADFVGSDRRFQKALAFIARRSQNTTQVSAGKFTAVSLVTFSWILRTSYSTFMVIRKANTPRM